MSFAVGRNNNKRKNSSVGAMYAHTFGRGLSKKHLGIFGVILFVLIYLASNASPLRLSNPVFRSQDNFEIATTTPVNAPTSFTIAVVADLDKKSKDDANGKLKFYSYLMLGELSWTTGETSRNRRTYSVKWDTPQKFSTKINEGGRGFELSELVKFNGELYTFDDRTGVVFSLANCNRENLSAIRAYPRYVITEGNGMTDKGQKHEWATVKDGKMYIGSIGKEYTDEKGNVVNYHNLWVAVINQDGNVTHIDWTKNYAKVRERLGANFPGYVVHEAIEWSPHKRKWFILPRRVSTEPYDDMKDEKRGSNKILIADEDFSNIEVKDIGKITPERGFSSFKFLPGSEDNVILAVKSMENELQQKQSSYVTVFNLDGTVLMEETEIPGNSKYEGVVFL